MTKLEELKAALDAEYAAWAANDAAYSAADDAVYSDAWKAYQAGLKKIQEEKTND